MTQEKDIQAVLREAEDGKHASRVHAVDCLNRIDFSWHHAACIRILRNYTLEPIEPFLKFSAYKRRTKLDVSFSDYDMYQQEILNPSSMLYQSQPDMVMLSLWLENLPMAFDHHGQFQPNAVTDHLYGLIDQIKKRLPSVITLNTFLPPSHDLNGWDLGGQLADGIAKVNAELKNHSASDNRLLLVDFEKMLYRIGVKEAMDLRYWFMFKAPFKPPFLSLWAETLAQVVCCLKGYTRKVLVVDCDNTLWGGIVGEDGIKGIKLSSYDYPGNVFHAFQKQVVELQRKGILVVLCSKNNENDVMEVLDTHPHCIIRREHLSAWRINWNDKATNLQALAKDLNLGLDSFVFIDDNVAEIELIREVLPMVDTLQVPPQVSDLPLLLQQYNQFNTLVTSREDNFRTAQYQVERERKQEAESFADTNSFLASLQLVAEIGEPKLEELSRVSQLTQKTNQFNLTTRRYGLGEIEAFSLSEHSLVLVMKVTDKYGEYGLTGACILTQEGDDCHIDTLLMSCRILGKRLEDLFLDEIIRRAKEKWRSERIIAEFIPTQKNCQVADFYVNHNFEYIKSDEKHKTYCLRLSTYGPQAPSFIQLQRRE